MAHFHIKKKKGRPYLYVREIARVNGKPKVVSQIYIGSPNKVASLASSSGIGTVKLKVEQFGALWLANQIDKEIDLAHIIDEVIPRSAKEEGPTLGEYFLYCVFNRMCESVSKNRLKSWYLKTAIQSIRAVDINELTSQRYWEKWDKVSTEDLKEIARRFFDKVWRKLSPNTDCLFFDTTNYYTFMASDTKSELAKTGKNKAGRDTLRQIGLGLLVERTLRLPLYYSIYPGNHHDSRHFKEVLDKMLKIAKSLCVKKEHLTVVVDKGMNSLKNIAVLDERPEFSFITNYSTYFAKDLSLTNIKHFKVLNTEKNLKLNPCDQVLVYRTKGVYWGRKRTVVLTFNPKTARKQAYTFESKLETINQELTLMEEKVKNNKTHWKNPEKIKERYIKLAAHLHVSNELFELKFRKTKDGLLLSFRKDDIKIKERKDTFGKNIIITDNNDWSTQDIVQASTDRWKVEDKFRLSKDDDLVAMRPIRHWTDSKIRCHMFSCIVAMTYLRLIELKLKENGINRTSCDVMDDMSSYHSVLLLTQGKRKPVRRLEAPTVSQSEVLSAFGYFVDDSGVLQQKSY